MNRSVNTVVSRGLALRSGVPARDVAGQQASSGAITPVSLDDALDGLTDDTGRTLRSICDERPTLVVLLRHAGCTFCRQTLSDLARCQGSIAAKGIGIAVIGMSESTSQMRRLGDRYGLSAAAWIADPDRLGYRALEIGRGQLHQLLSPRVLWAGLRAAMEGHGIGRVAGDPRQMPGTAIVHRGIVLRRIIHQSAAGRPDYEALACSLDS